MAFRLIHGYDVMVTPMHDPPGDAIHTANALVFYCDWPLRPAHNRVVYGGLFGIAYVWLSAK